MATAAIRQSISFRTVAPRLRQMRYSSAADSKSASPRSVKRGSAISLARSLARSPLVGVPLAKSPGAPRPGLDRRPIPRRLAGHGPARLRHELAVTPRVHGLRPHAEAHGNLRRTDGNRLAGRWGGPTRHRPIVAFSVT